MEEKDTRKVDPGCANASNPFHVCTASCSSRRSKKPSGIDNALPSVLNGMKSREEAGKLGRSINADPRCVYASNPYHKCSNRCSQRLPRKSVLASGKSREHVKMGEKRKVDPGCPNASNPFHQCSENCSRKDRAKDPAEYRNYDSGSKSYEVVKQKERRDVRSKCANATNPYHRCTENCSQRTKL